MGAIKGGFDQTYRDYRTAGVPASGANEPVKSEIRALGLTIEQAIGLAVVGSGASVVKTTRALLYADLSAAAGVVGFVYADANPLYNDFYVKAGGAGVGAWNPTSALNDVVAGTVARNGGRYVYGLRAVDSAPDAIKVVTEGGVPTPAYSRWDAYSVDLSDANVTATPTFQVNGLAAKTLRTATGAELAVGELQPGMQLLIRYVPTDDEFRIMFKSLLPGSTTPPAAFVKFTAADPDEGRLFVGTVNPDPIADPYAVIFQHKITAPHVDGGVDYTIPEFTSEPRPLRDPDNTAITAGRWNVGDTILVRYVPANHYELVAVLPAGGAGEAEGADAMQQYYARSNSNVFALRSFGK